MTKIRVGIYGEPSQVVIINKPFDYIRSGDVLEKIGEQRSIIGWCEAKDA